MRLICPNCGAQYEVADDVVPASGRDVQCSNCGHTWFERPGESEAREEADGQPVAETPAAEADHDIADAEDHSTDDEDHGADTEDQGEDDHSAVNDDETDENDAEQGSDENENGHDDYSEHDEGGEQSGEGDEHEGDDAEGYEGDEFETDGVSDDEHVQEEIMEDEVALDEVDDFPDLEDVESLAPTPQDLDPGITDILREEAEFEQAARQQEADPIETQPDLGLSDATDDDARSREAQERLARLRGEPEVALAGAGAAAASAAAIASTMAQDADAPRRELLPDIEEINSTLRPEAGVEADDDYDDMAPKRSWFRRGFMTIIFLALFALAIYIFAPQISAAVPALEGVLNSYVAWVDGMRVWLDGQVQGLISGSEAPTDAAPESDGVAPSEG